MPSEHPRSEQTFFAPVVNFDHKLRRPLDIVMVIQWETKPLVFLDKVPGLGVFVAHL